MAMDGRELSERKACRLIGQHRSTQRRRRSVPSDEARLIQEMRDLAKAHPRFGYRRIHRMLLGRGWKVNHKRIQRLWRQEGLKVAKKRRRKRAKGHSGNSCALRRAEHRNHVWGYDFLDDRTEDGRQVRLLVIVDE